ncbi:UDP-N-acetylmuramoylalanyl-D-glutamate--2,6-diaminopimelate ligase [Geothermobacter ehrlichii]|uniref:UDP-N-acetylmuramoyl-L-alanyl-D-glutamate--2,6-diaminopimelate ligase n=1 Tax=Geothermobacter ehrlichii TaxID=213224 RepID=A0A5D3WIL5_9BACT|nr:UDP-N-acetylmuramoyl-L-alanyl-D-glutamate--2,6-diaminopimelate ligase [Geothermobacter ehrlichii]TYO96089.1 UDP-N-acetylmuramoylalanyl-D-glutamate--2,6-diaminopimelate ligase [Geothermobacter ehrlichii]
MKLSELTAGIEGLRIDGNPEVEVGGICYDSRRVKPGDLFCALRGAVTDGHRFIDQAVEAGAGAVLREDGEPTAGVTTLQTENGRAVMAALAARFYGHPTAGMKVVGITGTNGKTTVSYLLESLLNEADEHVAVIGTVAYRFGSRLLPAPNTTPEAVDLQRLAAEFREQGCTALVMEVSSHALAQQRVVGVAFDVGVFTNLTPEHLDYHREMESYFAAKRLLFAPEGGAARAVINIDDPWGVRLAKERPDAVTCGFDAAARVRIVDAELGMEGIRAKLATPAGELSIRSPLLGRFNLANLVCAAGVGVALGMDTERIERGLAALQRVPGRLESVENRLGARILVDYAHTGDALEKALETLRDLRPRRLLTVFGCGGDRDRGKRPQMGEVAARLSDLVIVTSDNPRSEDPQRIIADILPGLERTEAKRLATAELPEAGTTGYLVIADRRRAIETAVALTGRGDILLVAGKGHEDYQIIGARKIHFDDREEIRRALDGRTTKE